MPELIFITGGVRSGKSSFALELAAKFSSRVAFVATAAVKSDPEMKARIIRHRDSRPSHWLTIEEQMDVASVLVKMNSPQQVVVVDCLTLLISNLILDGRKEHEIMEQVQEIASQGKKCNRATIIVSNEVGSGVVPPTKLGREFRDSAGLANQILAREANEVYFLVCGIASRLK